jgi:hypothetical protein
VRLVAVALVTCVACGDSQPSVTLAEVAGDARVDVVVIDYPWQGGALPVESSITIGVTLRLAQEDCPRLTGPVTAKANDMVLEVEPGGWPDVGISCEAPRAVTHQTRPAAFGSDLVVVISDGTTTVRASMPDILRDYTVTIVEPPDAVLHASEKVRALWGPDPLVDARTESVAASLISLEYPTLTSEIASDSVIVAGNEIRFSVPETAGWHTASQLSIEGMELPEVPAAECVGASDCTVRRHASAVTTVQLNPLP